MELLFLFPAPGLLLLLLLLSSSSSSSSSSPGPNLVLLLADDLGWGDLGCTGHPVSVTPNLDRLAAEGLRFTDYYSTSPVCSPARAALLTGRYQTRSGIYPGVLYPGSRGGLPLSETTVAELLRHRGYATAAVGKWHLGVGANGSFLPTRQGFDHYLGVPYSHDMGPCWNLTCFPPDVRCFGVCDPGGVFVPLMADEAVKQQPVDFLQLEDRYRKFIRDFITTATSKGRSFFLYHPAHHTHYPQFSGQLPGSPRGPFGDSLQELDATIGVLLEVLESTGVANNTLVHFTSDNGPELMRRSRGGNSGLLKCGKGTTYEGGSREPSIFYWPGKIKPGVSHELASILDVLPTFARLGGVAFPIKGVASDIGGVSSVPLQLDGFDLTNTLLHGAPSPRDSVMFYPVDPDPARGLFALRLGKFKAHFYTRGSAHSATTPDPDCPGSVPLRAHDPPLVFDLEADPSENYPLDNRTTPVLPRILAQIQEVKLRFEAQMEFGESQMNKGTDPDLEPCCQPQCTPRPACCTC